MTTQSKFATLFAAEGDLTRQARWAGGLLLGAATGLVYGAVANTINSILLWGVPLRVNPEAMLVGTLLWGAGMLVIGLMTAWPQSSFKGIVFSALALAVFGVVRAYAGQTGGAGEFVSATFVLMTVFLPSAALSFFITAPLRLAINGHEEALHYAGRDRLVRMGRVWIMLILVAALVGSFAQMSGPEKEAVRQVNGLIQRALTPGADLPPSLAGLPDFRERAQGQYTLAQFIQTSADPTIGGSMAVQTVTVDVLFESGLHFQCLVGESLARPLCTELSR